MTIDEIVEEFKNRNLIEWNSTAHSYRSRQQAMVEFLYEKLTDLRKQWLREEIMKLEGMRKKTNYPVNYSTSEGRRYTAMRDNHAGFNTCIDVLVGRYEAELNKK